MTGDPRDRRFVRALSLVDGTYHYIVRDTRRAVADWTPPGGKDTHFDACTRRALSQSIGLDVATSPSY